MTITNAGGNPNLTIISESGLYSLILTSRAWSLRAAQQPHPRPAAVIRYEIDTMALERDADGLDCPLAQILPALESRYCVGGHHGRRCKLPHHQAEGDARQACRSRSFRPALPQTNPGAPAILGN